LRAAASAWYTPPVPHRARPGRPSWIVAAAVFATAFFAFVALADGIGVPGTNLTPGAVAGADAVAVAVGNEPATPEPRRDAAVAPPSPSPSWSPPAPLELPPLPTAAPVESLTGYEWPLRGRLTLGFRHSPWGSRLVDGERFHDGIDLATFCGDRIRAAHSGVVLAAGRRFDDYVGWIGDLGPYYERLERKQAWSSLPIVVVIDDGNGYRSIYAHFSKVSVKKGDRVRAGDVIGVEGATGRASGCHLHYGIFSPLETERFGLHPDTVKRMKLPAWEIARIDPLLVLPERPGFEPAKASHREKTPAILALPRLAPVPPGDQGPGR
jgi:murein DD-endopeptidase MepM/ murein hydrolase activator NlpD